MCDTEQEPNHALGPLDAGLVHDFYTNREIFMEGEFREDTVNAISRQLIGLTHIAHSIIEQNPAITMEDLSVTLHISSYGGSVHEFFRVYDIIQSLPFRVNTIAHGKAMSAGAFLLMTGTGERMAHANTSIMVHGVQSMAWGSMDEIENNLSETKRLQNTLKRITRESTGLDADTVNELFATDNYMTPAKARQLGIIDKVVTPNNKIRRKVKPVKKTAKKATKKVSKNE